jgi:hypothetical protein
MHTKREMSVAAGTFLDVSVVGDLLGVKATSA